MPIFIKPTKPALLATINAFAASARSLGIPLVWDGDAEAFELEGLPTAERPVRKNPAMAAPYGQEPPAPQPTALDQIVFALERAQVMLRREADNRIDNMDYSAEFPYEDAERLGEAIKLLRPESAPDFAKAARVLTDQDEGVTENEAALREVFASIRCERFYQDHKWGTEREHEVGAWLGLMQVHLNEALRQWASQKNDVVALQQLRKVLALGTACGEQHGLPGRTVGRVGP